MELTERLSLICVSFFVVFPLTKPEPTRQGCSYLFFSSSISLRIRLVSSRYF